MVTVKEQCTSRMTLTFRDEDNILTVPASGAVKIIDVKTGTVIREWTSFVPEDTSYIFYITAEENRILARKNVTELRKVFCTFLYGTNQRGNDEYEFTVKNLSGLS